MQIFSMLAYSPKEWKNPAHCSNSQAKNSDNAVGGLVLPPHCTASCLEKQKTWWHFASNILEIHLQPIKTMKTDMWVSSYHLLSCPRSMCLLSAALLRFSAWWCSLLWKHTKSITLCSLSVEASSLSMFDFSILCEVEALTNVLKRLPQFTEVTEAKLHHTAAPLVHSVVLVRISSNSSFYWL